MQPFSAHFESPDTARDRLDGEHVLAFIEFGNERGERAPDPRRILVGMPQFGAAPVAEIWTSPVPVVSGVSGKLSYSRNDQILLGHLRVDERDHQNMEVASRAAYDGFLPFAREMGYPHYLRIWNYIPDINGDENGVERYKHFCIGRHAALERFDFPQSELPAASGVGISSGAILIYFLAAREGGVQIENPRQVSAFHYPSRYSPKSPAFSRAMFKNWGTDKHLYISGTASIVGHESLHGDKVTAQLTESLLNISTLLHGAHTQYGLPINTLADLSQIKVYIRDKRDYEAIRHHIDEQVGEKAPVVYLRGDLCRSDLLVEVEAFYAGRG
jgi:chorismate lyase/3-hydroxybenzoate synthase